MLATKPAALSVGRADDEIRIRDILSISDGDIFREKNFGYDTQCSVKCYRKEILIFLHSNKQKAVSKCGTLEHRRSKAPGDVGNIHPRSTNMRRFESRSDPAYQPRTASQPHAEFFAL